MNYKDCKALAKRIVNILRITDEKGLLSLTNITMMIVMYKIAVIPVLSVGDLTALALGVFSYQAKRIIEK